MERRMRGISSVGVRVIPQLARMGESDGLFDNKQEVNGDSRAKMVGPMIVLFGRAREL